MNIRRVLLDVGKAIPQPEIIEVGEAIDAAPDVAGVNITVAEIDVRTIGAEHRATCSPLVSCAAMVPG